MNSNSKWKYLMFFIVLVELIVIVFILSRFSKHTSKNLIPHESDLPIHPFIGNENDPFLGYKLKKNFFQLYDGDIIKLERTTTIETNSFGIRDREFQVPKPNNTVRIIILGDSFTFGLGVELNETYAKILEDKLNKLETEKTYEVLNFGVPGYNTTQEIEFFKLYGIQFEPDIIILAYTGDDLQDSVGTLEMKKQYIIKKFGEDYNVSDPRVFREIVRINYIISEKNIRKNLIKPDYKIYEILNTSFMKLKAIISPDTPIIIVKFPTSEKETYALKKIANENNWYFIELDSFYKKHGATDITLHWPQDNHLNVKGHKLVASEIFRYMIENKLALEQN